MPSPASLCGYNGLSYKGCIGEPLVPLWRNVDCHQLVAQTVLMFISVIDVRGQPPFFSCSSASFRFFRMWNATCVLSIRPCTQTYTSVNKLIVSINNLQR